MVEEIDGSITATEEGIEIEHAYIELGGFLIGETDSFFSTFGDYAGAVIQDDSSLMNLSLLTRSSTSSMPVTG